MFQVDGPIVMKVNGMMFWGVAGEPIGEGIGRKWFLVLFRGSKGEMVVIGSFVMH